MIHHREKPRYWSDTALQFLKVADTSTGKTHRLSSHKASASAPVCLSDGKLFDKLIIPDNMV